MHLQKHHGYLTVSGVPDVQHQPKPKQRHYHRGANIANVGFFHERVMMPNNQKLSHVSKNRKFIIMRWEGTGPG